MQQNMCQPKNLSSRFLSPIKRIKPYADGSERGVQCCQPHICLSHWCWVGLHCNCTATQKNRHQLSKQRHEQPQQLYSCIMSNIVCICCRYWNPTQILCCQDHWRQTFFQHPSHPLQRKNWNKASDAATSWQAECSETWRAVVICCICAYKLYFCNAAASSDVLLGC